MICFRLLYQLFYHKQGLLSPTTIHALCIPSPLGILHTLYIILYLERGKRLEDNWMAAKKLKNPPSKQQAVPTIYYIAFFVELTRNVTESSTSSSSSREKM